ncbi:Plancitoxin-1 [Amphibalanus amphitrite]|uniref:Plancitoxin-1 n=1 Tax=Amphibalanus amphitrite TaxID=1232801 RepID=A0A6A4WC95_AMPAM|nr:Plancitoxin-1 [Amphibalanus amphitrite]
MTCAPVVVMCPSGAGAAGDSPGGRAGRRLPARLSGPERSRLSTGTSSTSCPSSTTPGAPFVDDGVGFLHFSAASTDERWTLSEVSIDDPLSAPGRTLEDVYDNPQRDTLIYVFYNDEHPDNSTTGVKGHTKGVVAFDGDQGFWLIHSLETVAQQLLFNEPYLYATQLAPGLEAQYPLMARVIAGERRSEPPWFGVETLPSGDATFTSYAKARDFRRRPTWRNGATETQLPSNCSAVEPVLNVQNITATAAGGPLPFEFGTTKDHSKWAVS